jgi:endo-1,4-beta-D-glucanase Y
MKSIANMIEIVTNAVTDGKMAEVLRTELCLLERQLGDATLRAEKAEAHILVLEDENKKLHAELGDFRKAARQKDDSHSLSEDAVRVLQWIGRNSARGSRHLQRALGIEDSKMDYLASVLTRRGLIDCGSYHPSDGSHHYATDSGLDYLASNNLL